MKRGIIKTSLVVIICVNSVLLMVKYASHSESNIQQIVTSYNIDIYQRNSTDRNTGNWTNWASIFGETRDFGAFCDPKHAPWSKKAGTFYLPIDKRNYYINIGNAICFKEGVDFSHSYVSNDKIKHECACKSGWFGTHCSIPASVKYSNFPANKFTPVPIINRPVRRVINIFPFNMEFDMLEARFHEFGDIVDAFVILESNYTAHGDPKPLRLLERLRRGYYGHVSCKIVHVFLDYFPPEAKKNGWAVENLNRNFIGTQGLAKQLFGTKDDDLIMLNDADELPTREVIQFLKMHTDYPEPIGIQYTTNCYGFFWINKAQPNVELSSVITYKFLKHVFKYEAMEIRKSTIYLSPKLKHSQPQAYKLMQSYLKTGTVSYWKFGSYKTKWSKTFKTNSGWHCSFCFKPEHIAIKLVSAQNGDFPRWGDFPAKTNVTYIENLIKTGSAFNDEKVLTPVSAAGPYYAPNYFLNNFNKFKNLLVNPYQIKE